ncbi:MAG TPA: VOC family protein [Gemmatimonadaceae bacterium]
MTIQIEGVCPLLMVFDMPASLAFYRDVLGFSIATAAPAPAAVRDDQFGWVWLKRDATELMLNTAYDPDDVRPPIPDASRVAAHEDTVLYFGCRDLDGMHRHLRDSGFDIAPPKVTYYDMRQLYLKDPDGYSLCFQWSAA